MRARRPLPCVVLVLSLALPAQAQMPEFMPYRALYPALYLDAGWQTDPADEVFDGRGQRRAGALSGAAGPSRLPHQQLHARLAWTFPLFEQDGLPFFSKRLHTARVTLRYHALDSRGAINTFIDAQPGLQRADGGLGDTTLEFGSFLSGSEGWREGRRPAWSSLLLWGLSVPTGIYDRDAPANAGTNHLAAQVRLGVHGAPWQGGFVDAGLGYRVHGRNDEPAFGALEPSQQGDQTLWDAQLAQRLRPGLYVALAVDGSEGARNRYRDPRFSLEPAAGSVLADTVPVPGEYRDQGTDVREGSLSLRWFLSPRIVAGLHYMRPLSGRSGEFEVERVQRAPAGCNLDAPSCVTTPAEPAHVEGLGVARSYASDRWGVSFIYQFGQGNTWACNGCAN